MRAASDHQATHAMFRSHKGRIEGQAQRVRIGTHRGGDCKAVDEISCFTRTDYQMHTDWGRQLTQLLGHLNQSLLFNKIASLRRQAKTPSVRQLIPVISLRWYLNLPCSSATSSSLL